MAKLTMLDRYRGCLLGLAVGDALGATLEFMDRDAIARKYGRLREMIGGGWLDLQPGEITDDTEMALCIARSIAECGRVDPADIGSRFLAWLRTGPRDVGNTVRASLMNLERGMAWDEAGLHTYQAQPNRTAGNGSLMCTAPIALACRRDPSALAQASLDVSRITHADPRATWACVALNQALVALMHGREDVLAVASQVEQDDGRRAVLEVPDLGATPPPSGGFVIHTLQAALWCLLRQTDFEETVVDAVNLGGDADTTGAVAGALAGARYGARAIPERWLAPLTIREELIALADALYEHAEQAS